MELTLFDLASRYVGIHEIAGNADHPLIQWWLSLCGFPTTVHDEVAWCSAFVNGMAWELRLKRSKSAAARSWLTVGTAVALRDAVAGYDVVVLRRGTEPQPGPDVLAAPGHVGLYAGPGNILGGNQGNGVCVEPFDESRLLGVRRLVA